MTLPWLSTSSEVTSGNCTFNAVSTFLTMVYVRTSVSMTLRYLNQKFVSCQFLNDGKSPITLRIGSASVETLLGYVIVVIICCIKGTSGCIVICTQTPLVVVQVLLLFPYTLLIIFVIYILPVVGIEYGKAVPCGDILSN
jgi:hypothetical protein